MKLAQLAIAALFVTASGTAVAFHCPKDMKMIELTMKRSAM